MGRPEKEYKDISAMYWTNMVGFWNQRLTKACKEFFGSQELHSTVSFGLTDTLRERFAQRLKQFTRSDPESRVIAASSGSIALDHALRAALHYHNEKGNPGKNVIAGLKRGYHGCTQAVLSAAHFPIGPNGSNINTKHIPEQVAQQFVHLPSPSESKSLTADLEKLLNTRDDIAALMFEPVQGAGATQPCEGYYTGLTELAKKNDVLLIADEVATFGRLGTPLACNHFGIKPDMVAVGKGISNGLAPTAALIITPGLYKALDIMETGNRYYGDSVAFCPLSSTIGKATLDVLDEEDLISKGLKYSGQVRQALHDELDDSPIEVNGIGSMVRLDFPSYLAAGNVARHLLGRGYYTNHTIRSIYVATPLVGSTVDFNEFGSYVRECYDELPDRCKTVCQIGL
jgi:beta-alanine--pyruvate transaminase